MWQTEDKMKFNKTQSIYDEFFFGSNGSKVTTENIHGKFRKFSTKKEKLIF